MRAVLKSLDLEPDPASLPDDPAEFALVARMIVAPSDAPGEESFDVTVCTPEWLAKACRQAGGIFDARHHLVVTFGKFDGRSGHGYRRGWKGSRPTPGRRSASDSVALATGSSRTTAPERSSARCGSRQTP